MEKILEILLKQNQLIKKEYNQKIYLVNQDLFEVISENEMQQLDKRLETTNELISKIQEQKNKLESELKNLGKELSNEELDDLLEKKTKITEELEAELNKLESQGLQSIPEEKMKDAEKIYEMNLANYKKVKRITLNIIDDLADGIESDRKKFSVALGLEAETEYVKKLKIKLN